MAEEDVALLGGGGRPEGAVGDVRAHVVDADAHGPQAGEHLERVEGGVVVAPVAAALVTVDGADEPHLFVVAQGRLAEPRAPGRLLDRQPG